MSIEKLYQKTMDVIKYRRQAFRNYMQCLAKENFVARFGISLI